MRNNVWLAIAATIALAGGGASAAELNSLSDIQVKSTGTGAQVVVTGTRAPTFTVFRLSAPDRLVVDLSGADASGVKGHHDGQGPVVGVVASQFSDERASVGVLPRNDATSFIALETARFCDAADRPGSGLSARAAAASTVACQVRKSLAVASSPVEARTYSFTRSVENMAGSSELTVQYNPESTIRRMGWGSVAATTPRR